MGWLFTGLNKIQVKNCLNSELSTGLGRDCCQGSGSSSSGAGSSSNPGGGRSGTEASACIPVAYVSNNQAAEMIAQMLIAPECQILAGVESELTLLYPKETGSRTAIR